MESDNNKNNLFTSHEIIDSYLDGVKEAVDFVKRKVIPILNGQINLRNDEKAILGTFYRIHALASSLTRLNKRIDFNAVAVICRTLFELLLDMKLLSSPNLNGNMIDRFFAFSEVDRFRKAKKVVEFQNNEPSLLNMSWLDSQIRENYVNKPGKDVEIETKVTQTWGYTKKGKPNWPKHWTGLSVKQQAENLGSLYELKYHEIYTFLSSYTHSGSTAYAGLTEDVLESVYGESIELSRKLYIESLLICAKVFSLKDGIDSFSQIVSFLENAPTELMIEYGRKKIKETGDKP